MTAAKLDLDALSEMEAHLPEMVWRGCKDHPELNSNPTCWGIHEPDGDGEKLRLLDVGERLVAMRQAFPALIAAAKRLEELESAMRFVDAVSAADLVQYINQRGRHLRTHQPEDVFELARGLGWDPKSKGGSDGV